jgi:hypothetical protein
VSSQLTPQLLLQDYSTLFNPTGWGVSGARMPTEGTGFISSQIVANPAAGADWIYTVGTLRRQAVRSFNALFTAAAAVANRQVELIIDDGANIMWRTSAPVNITANQVVNVSGTGTNAPTGIITTDISVVIPPGLVMPQNWRLRALTTAIQAADQWSAIAIMREEWIDV